MFRMNIYGYHENPKYHNSSLTYSIVLYFSFKQWRHHEKNKDHSALQMGPLLFRTNG